MMPLMHGFFTWMIFETFRIRGDQSIQNTGYDICFKVLIWSQNIRKFTMNRMTGLVGTNQTTDTKPSDFTVFAFHDTFYVITVFQGMTTDGADGKFTAFN